MGVRHKSHPKESEGSCAVFSRNVREILRAGGPASRAALCKVCGVSAATVEQWELGALMPPPRTCREIAKWANLAADVDLTRTRLVALWGRNANIVRQRWIGRIAKLTDVEVLDLQPGLDRILS